MTTEQVESIGLMRDIVEQILPGTHNLVIERVMEGVSTRVYRIRRGVETLYLRVLPEEGASFAAEALVHRLLRAEAVRVPEVLYTEPCHALLGRSLMVTAEVAGHAISANTSPAELEQILFEAGKNLAHINRVAVDGYGWIRRDPGAANRLLGEHATYRTWIEEEAGEALQVLAQAQVLSRREVQAIQAHMKDAATLVGDAQAVLAHGDFDGTHIYQQAGQYTGIIDFGEIRGTNSLYDLGHFQVEHPDLLPFLLAGYADVAGLPHDYQLRIDLSSLLVATCRLGRRLTRRPGEIYAPALATIRRMLRVLGQS